MVGELYHCVGEERKKKCGLMVMNMSDDCRVKFMTNCDNRDEERHNEIYNTLLTLNKINDNHSVEDNEVKQDRRVGDFFEMRKKIERRCW